MHRLTQRGDTLSGVPLKAPEGADLISRSDARLAEIRKSYVDDSAIAVALTRRLAQPPVKRLAKWRGD